MDSGQNYQRLTDEEQRGSNVNSTESTTAPPVLDSAGVLNISPTTMAANQNNLTAEPANNLVEPPSYNIAVDLPTYEEYEQTKQQEDEETAQRGTSESTQLTDDGEASRNAEKLIGTDSMFIVGFIFSFLFNWLGLLLSFCVMHTCAGRFGALAGFGLSIVKWVLIVKSNDWATGVADDDSWIWWLMMAFGMLISCSGFLHYISIKQKWSRKRYTFII